MEYENLICERNGAVVTVRLNRPGENEQPLPVAAAGSA